MRWHIDYLRAVTEPAALWFCASRQALQTDWAAQLARLAQVEIPLRGFGASDSRAVAHLAYFRDPPDAARFAEFTRSLGATHPPLRRLALIT